MNQPKMPKPTYECKSCDRYYYVADKSRTMSCACGEELSGKVPPPPPSSEEVEGFIGDTSDTDPSTKTSSKKRKR